MAFLPRVAHFPQALGEGPTLSPEMQYVQATSPPLVPTEMQLDVGIGQLGAMSIHGPAASQLLEQQNANSNTASAMDANLPGKTVATVDGATPDADIGLTQDNYKSLVAQTGEDGLPEYSTDQVVGSEADPTRELEFEENDLPEGKEHKGHKIKHGLKKLITNVTNKAIGA
jgi:hypothetical protein